MSDLTPVLRFMRAEAQGRTFGLPPGEKREAVRHGFLLCAEQVERFVRDVAAAQQDDRPMSPRDAA